MRRTYTDQDLVNAAAKAARRTYSPYSRFPVGTALLTAEGNVITGCNVENASYGLTLCAERVAVASAVAAGHRSLKKLAVVGGTRKAAFPCGACLQVLSEFCPPDFVILLARRNRLRDIQVVTLAELLPKVFGLKV